MHAHSVAQSCLTTAPWTTAHQAPLSMEFSRQEYWSGLSFPPPGDLPGPRDWTHVSCVSCIGRWILYHWATWEALVSQSRSVVSESSWLHGLYSPCNSPGQNNGVEPFPSPGDLLNLGIEPRFPALQAGSSPAEPEGKPKKWEALNKFNSLAWVLRRLLLVII